MKAELNNLLSLIQEHPNDSTDHINFRLSDLNWLCENSILALQNDPILLNLEAPITVVGDIHGQLNTLKTIFKEGGDVSKTRYLFIGDYVDRGPNSIETIVYLLSLKVKYPELIFLIRGNHEVREISKSYGLRLECIQNYNSDLWETFSKVFDWLPIAAIISKKIFCIHGGLSPELTSVEQIKQFTRPFEIEEKGLLTDLLWSDPSNGHKGWVANRRGYSFSFGFDVVKQFLEKNQLKLIIRGHQLVLDGYEFPFYPKKTIMTLFSAPKYCGKNENLGAIMLINDSSPLSAEIIVLGEKKKFSFLIK